MMPRQTGKSTTSVAYLLHYVVFNDSVNVGILANKAATARELLGRLQLAYENLPKWMQQGVLAWNRCLLYTSPSPRDGLLSRMPSSA